MRTHWGLPPQRARVCVLCAACVASPRAASGSPSSPPLFGPCPQTRPSNPACAHARARIPTHSLLSQVHAHEHTHTQRLLPQLHTHTAPVTARPPDPARGKPLLPSQLSCAGVSKKGSGIGEGWRSRGTMHQAPLCTMHRAPCTMHHAPCTMHHAPCTRRPYAPGALMHHAPCTMHQAPLCTMHHAPCTMHHAPCTMHHAWVYSVARGVCSLPLAFWTFCPTSLSTPPYSGTLSHLVHSSTAHTNTHRCRQPHTQANTQAHTKTHT